MPNLQHFVILQYSPIIDQSPDAEYALLPLNKSHTIQPIGHTECQFSEINKYKANPKLEILEWTGGRHPDQIKFTPPSDWEREGRRGVILREYVHSNGDVFRHFRFLLRVSTGSTDSSSSSSLEHQMGWFDWGSLNDIYLEERDLELAYESAGLAWDWVDPGRGLEFPEEGWASLTSDKGPWVRG